VIDELEDGIVGIVVGFPRFFARQDGDALVEKSSLQNSSRSSLLVWSSR
jgi:hypothetical protein